MAGPDYAVLRLQHAVVAWVQEHARLCEVIHGHEWGGMLADAFTLVYFRRLQHGVRSVVTPHGGHMWSMQWKPQRSFSVEPLRIDHQVRTLTVVRHGPCSVCCTVLQTTHSSPQSPPWMHALSLE